PLSVWVIPRPIVNRILTHAMKTAPQECVGLLSGNGRQVKNWHPLTNSLRHERRFLADPSQQIQIMKQLRDCGEEIVAIYHSHPGTCAQPSKVDLQEHHYPEALCLIISLDTLGRLDMNGFLFRDGEVFVQELTICD
ncbi:MAG TPA: M67 family metallopeptidase, partial [Magnetococcales bacterium]|nr:M67 family metallopeptidase [Magnetococcales bacterium]